MPRHSKNILLVDDDHADRFLFSRELTRNGFNVMTTASIDDAMAAIVAGGVDCLVTDQIMPMRGIELASLAAGVRSDLPVIVFSGAKRPEPMPRGAIFVSKNERGALVKNVGECTSSSLDQIDAEQLP